MNDSKKPAAKPRKTGNASEEQKALRLAETTDVSPLQAKELMRKHGKDSPKVDAEARNFKAES